MRDDVVDVGVAVDPRDHVGMLQQQLLELGAEDSSAGCLGSRRHVVHRLKRVVAEHHDQMVLAAGGLAHPVGAQAARTI